MLAVVALAALAALGGRLPHRRPLLGGCATRPARPALLTLLCRQMPKMSRKAAAAATRAAAAAAAAGLSPPSTSPGDPFARLPGSPGSSPCNIRSAGFHRLAAANKAKKRRRGSLDVSGHKPGTQGASNVRLDIRYRPYPVLPPENLKYEDEEAQRRGVIQWFYRAEGSPDPSSWDGAGGLCDRERSAGQQRWQRVGAGAGECF